MKPELMKKWFFVQNGRQIDIHVKDYAEDREITVVANVRDEECAYLIAGAPRYREALEKIVGLMKLSEGEIPDPRAQQMYTLAFDALDRSRRAHRNRKPEMKSQQTDWHVMKVAIYDISTRYLAFVTGHKITDMHRSYAESETPPYAYFASLDNGPLQRLSLIRRQLEREYVTIEEKGMK